MGILNERSVSAQNYPFPSLISPLCGSQDLICRLISPYSSTTFPLPPLCPIPIFPSSVSALKEIGIHGYVGTGKCVSKEKGRQRDLGPLGISRKGILCFLNACLAFKKRRNLGLVFCRKGNQCCKKNKGERPSRPIQRIFFTTKNTSKQAKKSTERFHLSITFVHYGLLGCYWGPTYTQCRGDV